MADLVFNSSEEQENFEHHRRPYELPLQEANLDELAGKKAKQKHGKEEPIIIFDSGCGKSALAAMRLLGSFIKKGVPVRYIGIDTRPEVIAENKRIYQNISQAEFYVCDMTDLAAIQNILGKDQKADVLFLGHPVVNSGFGVRYLIPLQDRVQTAYEIFIQTVMPKLVKEGGKVIATHYNELERKAFGVLFRKAAHKQAELSYRWNSEKKGAVVSSCAYWGVCQNYSTPVKVLDYKKYHQQELGALSRRDTCRTLFSYGTLFAVGAAAAAYAYSMLPEDQKGDENAALPGMNPRWGNS